MNKKWRYYDVTVMLHAWQGREPCDLSSCVADLVLPDRLLPPSISGDIKFISERLLELVGDVTNCHQPSPAQL